MTTYTLNLPDELADRLDAIAHDQGVTPEFFLARMLVLEIVHVDERERIIREIKVGGEMDR